MHAAGSPLTALLCCREMLTYIRSAVTRNASEKKINSLLDFVAQSTNMQLLQVGSRTVLLAYEVLS